AAPPEPASPASWGEPSPAPPAESVSAAEAPAAEVPAPAATEAPAPATPPAQVGLGHIRDAWEATLQEVKRKSRTVGAFLNPSQPVRFDDGTLVVEVQSDFHKEAMSEEKNRSTLADALHAALGVRPPLRFVTRGSHAEAAPAAAAAPESDELADATAADAPEHDPVELIKKGFAAEVVEDRIGP
ncbi:MAG: hypothetical protein M3279_06310, partial [Actinomycetota bacterium]|nr:hypothetical protein [Actinomycetota bacterium]